MLDEDQREAHRGEVTPGSRSQGIQAKQGYTILCMEKGEGRVRFFIQKTGTIPITGILSNLKKKKKKNHSEKKKTKKKKNLSAKTRTNKQTNPAVQDHCLRQGLTICYQGKGRLQNMSPLRPVLSRTSPAFLLAEATLSPQSKQVRA